MEDQELQEIRARRLQQMQEQRAGGPQAANPQNQQELKKKQEEAAAKEEDFRNVILTQVLNQDARARLNTIKTAKPEKARMIEDILINNARMGMLGQGRISEDEFKKILEQVNSRFAPKETKINFQRRVNLDDSDDDLDFE